MNNARQFLCWLATAWDWIDKRDVDKHAFTWLVAYFGLGLTRWGMAFVTAHPTMSGADVALTVGAIGTPYALFAGAVVKWYFERKD